MSKKKINHQWARVSGPDIQPEHRERMKQNNSIMENEAFKKSCAAAEIEPTRRQASKFKRGKGRAYSMLRFI
jgi:hypothetical protein